MNWSFWEDEVWLKQIDLCVIGAGIVGLNTAIRYKRAFPKSKVVILEKGALPEGASTKNAGFACFGSVSEILSDLQNHSEEEVVSLVKRRWDGLAKLREILGDKVINYSPVGGYEVFQEKDASLYDTCLSEIPYINRLLWPVFKDNVFQIKHNDFGFNKTKDLLIFNQFEGHIHTGKMMKGLLDKARSLKIDVFYGATVSEIQDNEVVLENGASIKADKFAICTNGFASQFLDNRVQPARAQVLITEPIPKLKWKGTFHLDEGYYYFRNVGNRVLLGGGRNLDFEGENTTEMELTNLIQNRLDTILQEQILPGKKVQISHRWSGIMGVGNQKSPIVKKISENQYCAVRLGGMGVALGSQIGVDLAELIIENS